MPAVRPLRATLAVLSGAFLAGVGTLGYQVWRTVHRPDLPSFTNQDISGAWGDASAPRLRLVAVGDSSLTAPGLADVDDAWLRRLARAYADRHAVELVSLGVGGSLASDVLTGSLEAAVALDPDVAVVSVGGNDVIRAVPLARFGVALETIVSRLEAASGAVLLIGVGDLGAIPRLPPLLRRLLTRRSASFDRACSQVAAAHPRTVKAVTRPPAGACSPADPAMFAADQFHASEAGHARYAEAIAPYLAEACRLGLH
jgi:lysophospholipase L1-like esterase